MLLCLSYQGELFIRLYRSLIFLSFSDGFLLKQPSEHFHEETAVDDLILLVEVNKHTFQISIPLLY